MSQSHPRPIPSAGIELALIGVAAHSVSDVHCR
jgi:hypothetical protein